MNWRKYWRMGVCTLLIVTAEAHRVYDATHPRARKPGPGAAGQDEQLFVSKTKCLQPNFNTEFDSAGFRSVFPLSSAPRRAQKSGTPSRSLTLK